LASDSQTDLASLIETDIKLHDRIIRNALKRLTREVADFAVEAVRRHYNLPGTALKDVLIDFSGLQQLTTELRVRGTMIPIIQLVAVQTASGVTFRVKADAASELRSAFLPRLPSGHKGVFERTGIFKQARRGVHRGAVRETIEEKFTIGFAGMFGSEKVIAEIERFMDEHMPDILSEEFERAA
jgi:hypothetical protein